MLDELLDDEVLPATVLELDDVLPATVLELLDVTPATVLELLDIVESLELDELLERELHELELSERDELELLLEQLDELDELLSAVMPPISSHTAALAACDRITYRFDDVLSYHSAPDLNGRPKPAVSAESLVSIGLVVL